MHYNRFALMLILLMSCLSSLAGTRRALVIGIGTYEDPQWMVINGDRDVKIVVEMLKLNGFHDIVTLEQEEATKSAIVTEFNALAGRCAEGDTVYIHFSGHGQRMTDIDGDEEDGWDESWIPYDAYRKYCDKDHGERHLCDDEIGVLLTNIRKRVGECGVVAVAVDACHAGDSTRKTAKSGGTVRGVYDNFIIPGKHRANKRKQIPERWLTLSSCLDYQLNQEHPDGHGKLTRALYALWPEMKGMDNETLVLTLDAYYQRSDVKGRYPQTPVMTGETDKRCFSEIFKR
mgnify:FL=1